jgi:hypothetical protein
MAKWHDYIQPTELADTITHFNDKVGDSRHISSEAALSVAQLACDYYSYLDSSEEIADAIRYDVQSFAEYATLGVNVSGELEFSGRYAPLLASGHPDNGFKNLDHAANWISGAPELNNTAKRAIVAALSPKSSEVETLHANTRLMLMSKDGQLSDSTAAYLEKALSLVSSK